MRWGLVLPAIVAVAACDEPGVHILTAQLYDSTRACLGPSDSIDVVNGPATGDGCSPSCLTITVGDATSVYVTPVCPPFPGDYGVETEATTDGGADPCVGAFAAYDSEGGAVCPPLVADAGEGGEAGDDGGGEAGDGGGVGEATADAGTD